MAVTSTPIFPQTIKNGLIQILNATGTNPVTLYTPGTNGSKIESIFVTTTDQSNSVDIQLEIVASAVTYILSTMTIASGSGTTDNVPTTNILNNFQLPACTRDSNGNPYIYLASGSVLKVKTTTTVTMGETVSIIANGGDY